METVSSIKNIVVIYFVITGVIVNLITVPKFIGGKAQISIGEKSIFISTEGDVE